MTSYRNIRLRPRVLKGNTLIDTTTTILGQKVSTPILVAPTAMQKMAHHDGEIATARGFSFNQSIISLIKKKKKIKP